MTQVIVLNGGSSSGKSTIARALQEILLGTWLTFGVDVLVDALPGRGEDPRFGLVFGPDGAVAVTPAYRSLEDAWYEGLASMARSGASVILDEVFLDGVPGQARVQAAFDGLDMLWVGVHCNAVVATAREAERPDRVRGMAARQALAVHEGVSYDVEVDTTARAADVCARHVAEFVTT